MMRALYTAATGMIAEQTNVDTIANNLSNVNTTGYKAERAEFKSLLYQTLQTRTTSGSGDPKPIGAQVGLGTRIASTTSAYTQGALNESNSLTDFALEGDGFFALRAADGQIYYTRNGNFTWSINAQGQTILATQDGCPVLDRQNNVIAVPAGRTAESAIFNQDGSISFRNVDGSFTPTGQFMAVYQFTNPAGLEKLSNSRLAATDASGAPMQEGTNAGIVASKICQGYLEASNVQVADEMVEMIVAQRAYELNSKAIQTADSMLDTANNLKR